MCAETTLVVTVFLLLVWPAMPLAATASKKITWANERVSSEGVSIKEIRFQVEGGVHCNLLQAARG